MIHRIPVGDLALPLAMVILGIGFGLAEPAFLSFDNLKNILNQMALTGIMAVFMTFVIMTGGIDLSIGPTMALSGVAAYFGFHFLGFPVPLAMLFALSAGVLVGCVNGSLVAFLKLPPIIVTLAMLSIIRGLALLSAGPDHHQIRDEPMYTFLGSGSIAGLPFSVWVFFSVAIVMILVQRKTSFGVMASGIGDNERAVNLSGRSVQKSLLLVYALSGLGAALAGMILSSQVHTASATFGEFGTELDVIAAVVLGGTNIMGGKGSVIRTVFGVLLLGIINNGLQVLNVPLDQQLMVKGVIIVLALGISTWSQKRFALT